MLESILKVGKILKAQGEENIPIERVKEGYGVKIIFNLDDLTLDCEPFECKGNKAEEKAKEFMWIGNPRGNSPQLRLTTNNPNYLLKIDEKKVYKWGIGAILKYIEEWKLSSDEEVKRLYQYLKELKEAFFTDNKDLTQKFNDVCNKKGINMKEITLCTISLEKRGTLIDLAKEPGYRKLLYHIIRYEKTSKYPLKYGKCHVCGDEGRVLTNPDYPKGTLLGIYVIDKIGFLSGVSNTEFSLLKTHTVCLDCKEELALGMNYINKYLSVKMGDLNAWIIPTLLSSEVNFDIITYCKDAFEVANSHSGFEKIGEVEEKINRLFERLGIFSYIVNIIFGRPQHFQFIFHGLISDIPITRFIEIGRISEKLARKMDKYFPLANGVEQWFIGFKEVGSIFPLTKVGGNIRGKPLIELFNAMLGGIYYPREHILERALLYVRIHRFGNYGGYNIREVNRERREWEICRGLLLYNLLLNLLVELGVIEMEKLKGHLVLEGVDKDIVDFCNEQGYSDWQTGLFLLGVLIGRVGIEQFKRHDKKKSILDKIDFDGMSLEKVKWLANVMLESLRNYRILEFNETIYAQAKRLIDKNLDALKNPLDNTFYVLSGYAYSTFCAIIGGREYE
jgi:CRISPR-associated protein Csh1